MHRLSANIASHVNKNEYKYSNQKDRASAREAQREAITSQRQAKAELERLMPDNLVETGLWLQGFNWTLDSGSLPLKLAANTWFNTTLSEREIPDPRPRDTDYGLQSTQLQTYVQGLAADFHGQRLEDRTNLERIENDWDDRYKEQIEKSQKLEQDPQATNTKLGEYKHHYRAPYKRYKDTEELYQRQMSENRRLMQDLRQPEQEKQDLEIQLASLEVHMKELEEQNASIHREQKALGAETRSLYAAKACIEAGKQASESNGQVTGVREVLSSSRTRQPSANPCDMGQQRGRSVLQVDPSAPTDNSNKNTYSSVSYPVASQLDSGRKRGMISISVSGNSTSPSSVPSRASGYMIANSSQTSNIDDRPRKGRPDSSCDRQSTRDYISLQKPRATSDKHENNAGSSQSRDSHRQLRGSRNERRDAVREQGHEHRSRDYRPPTVTLTPSRTTSHRSYESRAIHPTSRPEPVPPQLSAQSGHATSNIGAVFDHQTPRKYSIYATNIL